MKPIGQRLTDLARTEGRRWYDPKTRLCVGPRDTLWYAIALLHSPEAEERSLGDTLLGAAKSADGTHTPATMLAILLAIPDCISPATAAHLEAEVRKSLPEAALAEWHRKHPQPKSTLAQVADHIEHLRAIAGIDHVGIGSDFDGIEEGPVGLGNVSCYPALLIELARRGWSDEELAKVAGENILRAMAQAEAVAAALQSEAPKLQPLAHMAE